MSKFHMQVKDAMIPAGKIKRHPENQRKSPLRRFKTKLGVFDLSKVLNPIHVVSDGNGGYYSIDGATRAEGCNDSKDYGPKTPLPCKVYGNGKPPSQAELAELFLVLNTDKIEVSAGVAFEQAVMAGRPSALAAQKLIGKLGPNFRSTTGVWSLVINEGEAAASRAVEYVVETWGTEDQIPMQLVSAVSFILGYHKGGAGILTRRRAALRKKAPNTWVLEAKNKFLTTIGQRDSLQSYIVKKLLGRKTA